jgi:hypothetical protein
VAAAPSTRSVGGAAAHPLQEQLQRMLRCLLALGDVVPDGPPENLHGVAWLAKEFMRRSVDGGLPLTFEFWASVHDLCGIVAEDLGFTLVSGDPGD